MQAAGPVGERLGVRGDGWCLLYSVVISTSPERWPAEWVGSMDAHSAHAAIVAEARAGRLWGGGRGAGRQALDHAVEALQARVIWSLMAGGRDGVPGDVAATVRGTQDVGQLDRWLARASEAQLRARLTELGLADNHVIEDENWLPPSALQSRYIDERMRQLSTEGDASTRPSVAVAIARARAEAGLGAQGSDDGIALSLRSQFEYLRGRGVVPTVGQLRPAELSAAVSESSAHRFTEQEYSELVAAVQDWSGRGWRGRYGDTFAVLIAHTLQVQVQVHRRDGQSSAVGPEGARNISVYYNGHNHYEASLPPASEPTTEHPREERAANSNKAMKSAEVERDSTSVFLRTPTSRALALITLAMRHPPAAKNRCPDPAVRTSPLPSPARRQPPPPLQHMTCPPASRHHCREAPRFSSMISSEFRCPGFDARRILNRRWPPRWRCWRHRDRCRPCRARWHLVSRPLTSPIRPSRLLTLQLSWMYRRQAMSRARCGLSAQQRPPMRQWPRVITPWLRALTFSAAALTLTPAMAAGTSLGRQRLWIQRMSPPQPSWWCHRREAQRFN